MKRVLPYVILLFALVPIVFNQYHWISFYFERDLEAYRAWFPNLYLPLFLLIKFFYPGILGYWSAWLLSFTTSKRWPVAVIAIAQGFLVYYIESSQDRGLMWVSYDLVVLLVLTAAIIKGRDIYCYAQVAWTRLLRMAPWLSRGYTYFIFCSYIVLSLLLPEVQPFSRYPMYSQFPDNAETFLIRDGHGHMIPTHRYFAPGAADLSHLYYHLMADYTRPSAGFTSQSSIDSAVGIALYRLLMANQKVHPDLDTICVNMQVIRLSKDQYSINETTLYKQRVE